MEKFYPAEGQSTYGVLVVTDNKWKPFLYREDVPKRVLGEQFDWLDADTVDGFIRYQGGYYHTSMFERIVKGTFNGDWDGVHHTSQSTGVLIALSKDGEEYKIGSYRVLSEQGYTEHKLRKNPDDEDEDDGPLTETEKAWLRKRYVNQYGLTAEESRRLVDSGRAQEITAAAYDWAMDNHAAVGSPLVRGVLLEYLTGKRVTHETLQPQGWIEKDLSRLTPQQEKRVIDRLSRLPLSELRRRQSIVESQKRSACTQRNDAAWVNLEVMERHLDAAVDRKAFAKNGRLNLESIKVLFRAPETLALYGIPYELRPGQSPKDLHAKHRKDWIFLGYPGWFGNMPAEDVEEVKEFLELHADNIPGNAYDWTRIDTTAQMPDIDIGDGQRVRISNPVDYEAGSLLFFSFGANLDRHVLVWGTSVEKGLEEAAGFMKEQGNEDLFETDERLQDLVREVREELGPDADDDTVQEKATVDLTYTESGYIASFEWSVNLVVDPKLIAAATAVSERWVEDFNSRTGL
jgi:hypothetical protein